MKNSLTRIQQFSFVCLGLLCIAAPANALTARELMEKFSAGDRYLYIAGLVDMISYNAVLQENHARAQCVSGWFHGDNESAMKQIEQVFVRFPDRDVQPLLIVLTNQKCNQDE